MFSANTSSIFLAVSCKEEDSIVQDIDLITFEGTINKDFGIQSGGEYSKNVKVYVTNSSSSERKFDILVDTDLTTVDNAALTVSPNVTIPANSKEGEISVKITDVNIVDGLVLALRIVSENDIIVGEPLLFNVATACPTGETKIKLNINFDGYASETTFDIKDSSGTVVASGGGSWADGLETYSEKWCLASGSYTFTINDAYGDGLSYPSNGDVKLTVNDTGVTLFSTSGDFGYSTSGNFTL